jgi:predicted AlkP superfamily pyrophosphatase or phosphodiesterase
VFKSSLQSVTRSRSALGFQPKRKVLVILVDGMGAENVLARAGHAPRLAAAIRAGGVSYSAFPSTTSTNITSFATGLEPGESGFIGQVVSDRHFERNLNLLNGWSAETDPKLWQPNQTVSEMAFDLGVTCNVIAAEEYRDTGFTGATMRKAVFHGVDALQERFTKALELVTVGDESINYLYVPELDKYGHLNGWESPGWSLLLEEIASLIERLVSKLPSDTGLVVTADHGMVDTSDDLRHELAESLQGVGLKFVGGDTRVSYLYLQDPEQAMTLTLELTNQKTFAAYRASDFHGWLGPISALSANRMPDVVLLAKGNFTLYHKDFSKPKSYRMVAHHGGITPQELRIPLIRIGI